jgi:hypothetical protein
MQNVLDLRQDNKFERIAVISILLFSFLLLIPTMVALMSETWLWSDQIAVAEKPQAAVTQAPAIPTLLPVYVVSAETQPANFQAKSEPALQAQAEPTKTTEINTLAANTTVQKAAKPPTAPKATPTTTSKSLKPYSSINKK